MARNTLHELVLRRADRPSCSLEHGFSRFLSGSLELLLVWSASFPHFLYRRKDCDRETVIPRKSYELGVCWLVAQPVSRLEHSSFRDTHERIANWTEWPVKDTLARNAGLLEKPVQEVLCAVHRASEIDRVVSLFNEHPSRINIARLTFGFHEGCPYNNRETIRGKGESCLSP